jgi:hypothetical protein
MNIYEMNKRSIGMVIFLTIITCGIYHIIWAARTTEELARFNNNYRTAGIQVLTYSLITCGIYMIFWWYRIGKMFVEAQTIAGITTPKDNSTVFVILHIFSLSMVNIYMLQSDLNDFWDYLGTVE